ncbi:unnamed protein product [Medioppia subpectinata]|uniref:Uncharacterized protein n=1 Tax=Medioppia subpectinata TaxID=1979941 RepID=A0A7R9KD65_9ACAR|nr:unnamed protein product [Medioppia subpectinata]CAG2101064.1 unnamed protein product [Medioppia subpectinata]
MQTDIGSNFYVQTVITDPHKVFLMIGMGFYLELTLEEAILAIDKREALLNEELKQLSIQSSRIKANIKKRAKMSEPTATSAQPVADHHMRAEIERLNRELAQTSAEKIQSAQYGLVLLDEKEELQRRYDDLESSYETVRKDLEELREAFAKSQTNQKVSANTGVEREEKLLEESAHKEANFRSKASEETEWERRTLRVELKELKLRESRLLADNNELEEENISLQKQVSVLKSSQVDFETSKHEVRRLQEDMEALNAQLEEYEHLKRIAERQMEEALEALQSEREQKYRHFFLNLAAYLSLS